MHNTFEEIREQIHEIRNMLGPIDIKLDNLDHKITAGRISFDARAASLETKIAAESVRVSEQCEQCARISENSEELVRQSERIRRIELLLNIPNSPDKTVPAPVHEDKLNPAVVPPQKPPA